MNKKQLERIVKSTIHLLNIDPVQNNNIVGSGSACIIRYEDKEILLSVAHVTKKEETLTCIDVGVYSSEKGMELYNVGQFVYLEDFKFDKKNNDLKSSEVDFCYSVLKDQIVIKQSSIKFEKLSIKESNKLIMDSSKIQPPNINSIYSFFGRIKTTLIKAIPLCAYEYEPALYDGIKFLEKEGRFYAFDIGNNKMEHLDFYGTSGAPIMDEEGNVVALVAHGNDEVNKIYGIAINDFLPMIIAVINDDSNQEK
jgi:hypothetical protein